MGVAACSARTEAVPPYLRQLSISFFLSTKSKARQQGLAKKARVLGTTVSRCISH